MPVLMKNIQVSASILCADFTRLGDEIAKCESAGVDAIHVDVMDGHFVPPITIGQVIVEAIRPKTKLPIETHLMVEDPWLMIDSFLDAGSDIISLQIECYGERRPNCRQVDQYPKEIDRIDAEKLRRDISRIKGRGKRAHLVVNPGTPLCFDELLAEIDGVLIMSVNPGFAKQKFMPVAVPKIAELRKKFNGDIAVDGGVNGETAPQVVKAGANILATASYFFGAPDPKQAVKYLKSLR
jgi:ribulose-phosphate 3-epimerase